MVKRGLRRLSFQVSKLEQRCTNRSRVNWKFPFTLNDHIGPPVCDANY